MSRPIEKVLYVDDDPNILEGVQRQLRNRFHIEIAVCGEEGLATVASQGPFAVIITDMRMPGMDGIHFLSKLEEVAPHTIRMMLTGHADLQAAIEAVNEGGIFRLLTKPCSPAQLTTAFNAGLTQYRLVQSEKELTVKLQHMNAELARSNHELEQFASVASHDLQEPLRKIQIFGDRLMLRCHDALDEQSRDYTISSACGPRRNACKR